MPNSLTNFSLPSIVAIAYITILTAELVGDKAIYTISTLVLRFRAPTVIAAMAAAFAAKMTIAVLLGRLITHTPSAWIASLSAAAFFTTALLIWSEESPSPARVATANTGARAWLTCFLSLFLPEWGDPGQVAAAALTLETRSPLGPWLGCTLALTTKGILALAIGISLRDRLPRDKLRLFASASCCTLGVLALATIIRW